jgi:pSer/pThr/pTyr-binding forkhead associated (FHA) protein
MQSANGTKVNGKDVKTATLKAGDTIEIGGQVLRCS